MKNEIFNDDGRLNELGYQVQKELEELLQPFYNELVEGGKIRLQDIEALTVRVITDMTLKQILGF